MKTILYYTSNREDSIFEEKIRANILKQSDLPIVSVSQKPIDFGHNICVGDVGHSYLNLYRQQLIGAKEATTEYLVFAEADFLYPKEYFEFVPDGENVYLYDNVWILFKRKSRSFRRKGVSHGAQIVKREHLIDRLESGLEGMPEWYDGNPVPWLSRKQRNKVALPECKLFSGAIPAVSFKTGDGMSENTAVDKGIHKVSLPYWGNASALRKEYI